MKRIEELTGSDIHGWNLLEIIGRGADGVVYRAKRGEQLAAVKVFFPKSFMRTGLDEGRNRLEPQLALIGKKQHPNLVEVFEGGDVAELATLYLAMEYVNGTSLDKLVGRIPSEAIPDLVEQLSAAAKQLEDLGLVHRDIKPANVVVSDDFKCLTLLDLSIVHQLPNAEDDGRLSGLEFVATLRYSPPEFVWREEQGDANEAWRAVTFYQMGATIHDMIMGQQLFAGIDVPRARLYDCVRDVTPQIASDLVEPWLIDVTKACLLKDWRQRLQCVDWNSFKRPQALDALHQERRIRLLQARREEVRLAKAKHAVQRPSPSREQQLWQLNGALFLEVRTYLLDSSVFPRFHALESQASQTEYLTEITFEIDASKGFDSAMAVAIKVAIDPNIPEATKLTYVSKANSQVLVTATWTEMFSVETAFVLCQQAILNSVERVLTVE